MVKVTALLVGSTFNCQLRADHFLPVSFVLIPCWFPQELKQPRSEKSPRGCRCLLDFAHRQEKCFGCNRIFCKMVLSLNASVGQLRLRDGIRWGKATPTHPAGSGRIKEAGRSLGTTRKAKSTAGCEEPPTAWQGWGLLCQPYFLQPWPLFSSSAGRKRCGSGWLSGECGSFEVKRSCF